MLNRGKLAVLAMFAVALAAASFAWWWNLTRDQRSREFFGAERVRLIRYAPTVEILIVAAPEGSQPPIGHIRSVGSALAVYRRIDVSRAPGLVHARAALVDDASYVTTVAEIRLRSQSFNEVVRFSDGEKEAILAITHPDGKVLEITRQKGMQLVPKTAAGWKAFIKRNVNAARQSGRDGREP